jgi:Family of unknown function (DUF5689)
MEVLMNVRSLRPWAILFTLIAILGSRVPAHAQFYSGAFVLDNDKAFFPFASTGGVTTIRSLGYGGGVSSHGNVVAPGGFDPILSLFDSSGQFLFYSDDAFDLDSNISVPLSAGNYTAVLTQFDNFPNGPTLADGFFEDPNPNFAGGFNGRTPNWAVDISEVPRRTIAGAKAAPLGSLVTIDGVVISNNIDLISSTSSASIQVQDATGGLTVFGFNEIISGQFGGLPEGYSLSVQGTTSNFNGLLELTNPVVQGYFGPLNVPTPTTVSATDLQDNSAIAEALESSLVQLTNIHFLGIAPGQTFAGLTNYLVTDGISTATVRVATADLGLSGQLIPTGTVSIRGVLSQFDTTSPFTSGYQLLITRPSDIQAVPEPATMLQIILVAAVVFTRRRRAAYPVSKLVDA